MSNEKEAEETPLMGECCFKYAFCIWLCIVCSQLYIKSLVSACRHVWAFLITHYMYGLLAPLNRYNKQLTMSKVKTITFLKINYIL